MNLDLAQELCDHATTIVALLDDLAQAAPLIATASELLTQLRVLLELTMLVDPSDILGPHSSFLADVRALVAKASGSAA